MTVSLVVVTQPVSWEDQAPRRSVLSVHRDALTAIAAGHAWQAQQPDVDRFHWVVERRMVHP